MKTEEKIQSFAERCRFELLGELDEMVTNFIDYWTETSLNGSAIRFEGEKYFSIKRRFSTYKRLNALWYSNGNKNPIDGTLLAYNQALEKLNNGTNHN